jgi:hypothetical protein
MGEEKRVDIEQKTTGKTVRVKPGSRRGAVKLVS